MSESYISVIIVNYNCGSLLTQCVHAALSSTVPVEVFVSDNGSADGSIEHLRNKVSDDRLHIILNNENLGFAKASNIPLPVTAGDYILFLNPDCIIKPDTIESMLAEMKTHPEAGMGGCLILNSDGSEQCGCRRRVPTPARTLTRVLHLDIPFPFLRDKGMLLHLEPLPADSQEQEAISGAFMLVRREAMEDVGLMDEGYFLHCEDLDWCMRFRQKHWKILFVPDVEVTHAKGVCSEGRAVRVEWHKHKGMVRFYKKFFRHQYPLPLMWSVIVAVWLRFSLLAIVLTFRQLLR
ncbi:glycosyltransferase family 2 protein [Mariprofundus sp. EBB-1]|uniref:glycosyltransferase family 2 protein n=1 Tax=Mariprofundus sp. EBB-1 TaxID=2650971 RepID=UPI000EF187AF|nr:glycosyltransferase family 2 protein [Mariprofundus sp. EBB-1]RLL50878.1 glycosyltransferase family 2 protein [Mariprofundus sp. EBB-1]